MDDNDEQAIRESGRGHLLNGGPHRGQVEKRDEAKRKRDQQRRAAAGDAAVDNHRDQ